MNACARDCEQNGKSSRRVELVPPLLQFPLLLHFGAAPNPQFRRHALAAMFYVHGTAEYPPVILMTHVTQYLQVRVLES